MGFIGYRRQQAVGAEAVGEEPVGADKVVRIYLECRLECSLEGRENAATPGSAAETPRITSGEAVDVVFAGGRSPCRLRGVDGVLVLKKFYKLVFSLEERAREHGNDWRSVMESAERLLEHLSYTRNARDFTGQEEPQRVPRPEEMAELECAPAREGS